MTTNVVLHLLLLLLLLVHQFGVIEPHEHSDSIVDSRGRQTVDTNQTSATVVQNCAVRDDSAAVCRDSNGRPPPTVLKRNKRYVAFPEGSSFSVAFCATLGFVGNPSFIYFSWAINWGLAYELPNQTWILNNLDLQQKPLLRPVVLRRQRRELYGRLETAVDSMGYDGRQCILRALCESTQYFYKQGSNMVEELLRTIFSLPKFKVLSFEHKDLLEYDAAHRRGQNRVVCSAAYPACGMSLIEMALGEYSKQPFNNM